MANDFMSNKSDDKTLTKADIVHSVNEKLGFSKKESSEIVERVFEIIKSRLTLGEYVKISGFGKFEPKSKRSRRGRNPQTGAAMEITARRVLSFRPSQILRSALLKANQ